MTNYLTSMANDKGDTMETAVGSSQLRVTSGGTGFHIMFSNGHTASVQFGPRSYCTGRGGIDTLGDPFDKAVRAKVGTDGCIDAEVAAWGEDGNLIRFDGWDDTVKGWLTADEVLAFLNEVAGRERTL